MNEVIEAAWARTVERWDDPARHEALLGLVAQHSAFAWAAGKYKERAGDPIGAYQLADRLPMDGPARTDDRYYEILGAYSDARAAQIGAEALRPDLVHQFVPVAMAGDFVAARRDLAHQLGMPLGDPAQHEEGGPVAGGVGGVEQPVSGIGDPGGQVVPARPLDQTREVGDLEVLLQVDAEGVQRHLRRRASAPSSSRSSTGSEGPS